MSSDDDGENSRTKVNDQLKELKGSARGRPWNKMKHDRDDDDSDTGDSSKKSKSSKQMTSMMIYLQVRVKEMVKIYLWVNPVAKMLKNIWMPSL